MQRLFILLMLVLTFFSLSGNSDAAEKEKTTTPELIAVVTEKDGQVTYVSNLTADFRAEGKWIGSVPSRNMSSIGMKISYTEDRVHVSEHMNFPLPELRQFTIGDKDDPYDYRFEKQDGTTMLFRSHNKEKGCERIYEILDSQGKKIKSVCVDNFVINGGEIQGELYMLRGFSANAKTKSGKVGTIHFDSDKVKNIKFGF